MFFKRISQIQHRIYRSYLDVASSTPLDEAMYRQMPPIPKNASGANPHALHAEGVAARRILESAREQVAILLHAHPDEIIFTSGATESDNLALIGTIEAFRDIALSDMALITDDLEHAAVLETVSKYQEKGLNAHILPTTDGVVDPKAITVPEHCKLLIVSIMYINNEIGTVQPIRDIAKRLRLLRKQHPGTFIIFHCDATQTPAHYQLWVNKLNVDLLTLGATKLYTTKGVGVLYRRRGVPLVSIMQGGGQEYGLRPGTEPVTLIHQFAHALQYAYSLQTSETSRVHKLQTYFERRITEVLPHAIITAQLKERSPHISHIALKGFDSELLVIELDARGIAVSAKSACKNEESGESAIVEKLYGKGYGAVRFSFGRMTTQNDVERAAVALAEIVQKYERTDRDTLEKP